MKKKNQLHGDRMQRREKNPHQISIGSECTATVKRMIRKLVAISRKNNIVIENRSEQVREISTTKIIITRKLACKRQKSWQQQFFYNIQYNSVKRICKFKTCFWSLKKLRKSSLFFPRRGSRFYIYLHVYNIPLQ